MTDKYVGLYKNRRLSDGYPNMLELLAEHSCSAQTTKSNVAEILACIDKIIDISQEPRTAAVIGCGARPWAIKDLREWGFTVVGIEPVESSRKSAEDFLDGIAPVLSGVGEALPLETSSQRIVLLQSVLEHVDSVEAVLSESFRILQPGGVLFVVTNNRHKFSPIGKNPEYRVPFYNWFPSLVKESYVYKHLHFDPRLANYAVRPAVHWFTYAELCQLGRRVGFAQFYNKLDLVDKDTPAVKLGIFRRLLLRWCRANPWLRALVVSQLGANIYMFKRADVYPNVSRKDRGEFVGGGSEEYVKKQE